MKNLLVTAILLVTACDLQLEQLTVAPPGAIAELDPGCEEIELTRGVAIGVACTDANGNACEDISVSVSNAEIASAHVAYSADFVSIYDRSQATSFVVVGKREGETEVTVDSSEGSLTYSVKVLGVE